MLLVEVMVPSLGYRYDFELEETATVDVLIKEMIAVICQTERCKCVEGEQGLSLYDQAYGRKLAPALTLQECGVQNGHCLILI